MRNDSGRIIYRVFNKHGQWQGLQMLTDDEHNALKSEGYRLVRDVAIG